MIELSPDECERCQDLTKKLLAITLQDCEELGLDTTCDGAHAKLDKRRWKKLQSQRDVTVYADRNADSAWLPVMRQNDWESPIAVIGVGRMECSLEDVLFSLLTPNSASQRLRSFLMNRRPDKNCQLVPIVSPTQEAPLQSLAISRFVNVQNWPFTIFQSPKEMVVVFATGEITALNGKRCGYEMVQSVTLQSQSQRAQMPQSRALQARIFWEQPDGSIGVYNKFVVDAKYRLSDSVKQLMLCRVVMGFWKYVPRSLETKKLWWCVKNKKELINNLRTYSISKDEESKSCEKKVQISDDKPHARNRCEFCETGLCGGSKCRVSCQFTMYLSSDTGFLEQTLMLCLRCAAFVRSQNSGAIARATLEDLEQSSFGSAP
ncbi:uncharacterized protein PHALS_08581 [Plasmopara halstedii]|uniref:START-like domain n=1 Tax=Plasmopara halstedii TaxID=4781 RepID=A0A0P1AD71_PLAHL|nr:uncharacterized protein PHALS_08581 [Plasmopara halstedii]CEG38512.1 hypothetical protein PHALS_08581 [Plasmopara halstedii]|eukprot:XP_024574881.1 hypothetical protein PHALS_08581 [Plasmopara halstedii]